MATAIEPVIPPTQESQRTPPLQTGDRLSREEFERRYHSLPDLKKAELIEGVVYVPSPVNHRRHGNPHFNLVGWLAAYAAATPGTEGGDNSSLRLDLNSEPQPDACLIRLPLNGGQSRIDTEGYIVGAPELAAEVAASSVSYDLHDKLNAYRENGVQEYIVWRVYDCTIDWFVLRQGQYVPLVPSSSGLYQSEVFPGLWLDSAALLAGNLLAVIQAVQQGIATPEHAAFLVRLQQAGKAKEST